MVQPVEYKYLLTWCGADGIIKINEVIINKED